MQKILHPYFNYYLLIKPAVCELKPAAVSSSAQA